VGFLAEGRERAVVERIRLDAPDVTVDATHARPEGAPRAGVVVHPDIMGVRPLFDEICRRLATHGYAVCAPEPFARFPAAERAASDPSTRMAWVPELDDVEQLGDLRRAADHLVAIDDVDAVGIIGFCIGGHYTLKAAAAGRFDRAVPFYGMIRTPPDWKGPDHGEPLERIADVCPTLAIIGGADPWTPSEDVEALRSAFEGRADCDLVVYPEADHGFVHDPERPAHRPDDAADAWRRCLAWLDGPTG
jgi:carboxymethylenebutenolidase